MWKYKPKINLEVKKSKAEKVAATVSPSVRQHFCGGERVEVQAYIAEREKPKIKMYQRTQAGDTTSTEKHQLVDVGRASLVVPPALLQWRWSDNISVLPGEEKKHLLLEHEFRILQRNYSRELQRTHGVRGFCFAA